MHEVMEKINGIFLFLASIKAIFNTLLYKQQFDAQREFVTNFY